MKKLLKTLPVILLLSFVITCVSINVLAEENKGEIGDVNCDGNINAKDALEVLKHAAKINILSDITNADVTRNNTADATDALWILKYAAHMVPDLSLETINATPTPSPTPVPVQDNISKLKNYVKTNGTKEDNVSYIAYSLNDNNLAFGYIVYYGNEDLLQLEITYYEEYSASEATEVDVFMPLTGNDTESIFFAGYQNGDYAEYLEAVANIDISSVTYNSNIKYTTSDSYNVSDADKEIVLKEASTMTTDSFVIWDYMINECVGFGLKELGFSKL